MPKTIPFARLFACLCAIFCVALWQQCALSTAAPSGRYQAAAAPGAFELVDMTDVTGLESTLQRYSVVPGINLTQYAIDKDRDGYLDDPAFFARELHRRIPRTYTGLVSLDWESRLAEWLNSPVESKDFQRAVVHVRELLILAKRTRPDLRFGMYGLPARQYWKRDDAWRQRSLALAECLREADWIGPSLYTLYHNDQRTADQQRRYATENVAVALEVAKAAGGKPVYVFINHRYHGSNKSYGRKPIEPAALRQHLLWILDASHEGRHVRGLIFWSGDDYYHKQGELKDLGPAPEARLRTVHSDYMTLMAEAIEAASAGQ